MGNIAIITARGGSKRIPRKNIRNFMGHPIIKYSIEAAVKSGCFDEIMVSTDDREIAEISMQIGASVPFLRSENTSNDFASTDDVIEEVLLEYKKMGDEFDYCCCIYPTAPFVTSQKLIESFNLLKDANGNLLVPVVRYSHPIQRALKIESGRLIVLSPEEFNKRSQDLAATYHDAGQFYWMKTNVFLQNRDLINNNAIAFKIPEAEAQDIDNESDWDIAELKFRFLMERKIN